MVENTDLLAFKTTFICRTTTQPATLTLCTGPSHRWWRIMSSADESHEVLRWGWFLTLPEADIQTASLIWHVQSTYTQACFKSTHYKDVSKQCLSNTLYCLREQVLVWYAGVTLKKATAFFNKLLSNWVLTMGVGVPMATIGLGWVADRLAPISLEETQRPRLTFIWRERQPCSGPPHVVF